MDDDKIQAPNDITTKDAEVENKDTLDPDEVVEANETKLTREEVLKVIDSFIEHIAQNWDTYKNNLPLLARTMMTYDTFAEAISYLPEEGEEHIAFIPREPLMEDNIKEFFGDTYKPEMGSLIYDAWAFLVSRTPWKGYQEPIDDTPEALMSAYPSVFSTIKDAEASMANDNIYADIDGQRRRVATEGTPVNYFRGFTTAEEFPQQKAFLDSIRNHPRIKLGIETMREEHALEREVAETRENIMTRLREIAALKAEALNDPVRLAELSAEFDQLSETQFTLDVDTLRAQKRQQQA